MNENNRNLPATLLEEKKDRALDILSHHFSKGILDIDEYENRAELVMKAKDENALEEIVSDLPRVTPPSGRKQVSRSDERTWEIASNGSREASAVVAIFSGGTRKGVWSSPKRIASVTIFGGTDLDFRHAIIPEEGVDISVVSIFGGMSVIVPPDINVEVQGVGIFGGFDGPRHERYDPSVPTIRVRGVAVFGGVGVAVKK